MATPSDTEHVYGSPFCWYLFTERALRESLERVRDGRSVDDEVIDLYVKGHPGREDPAPGGVRVFEIEVSDG